MISIKKYFPLEIIFFIWILAALSTASIISYLGRVYFTQSNYFGFLVWNLFLAFVPLVFSWLCYRQALKSNSKVFVLILLGGLWLLFFPNSPYIITDFVHLRDRSFVPIWYDGFLICLFSLSGLLAGFVSLYFIHQSIIKLVPPVISWIMILIISVLCGYGVFLGRELRFNSWDVFSHPFRIVYGVLNSLHDKEVMLFTSTFMVIVLLGYIVFYWCILSQKTNQKF